MAPATTDPDPDPAPDPDPDPEVTRLRQLVWSDVATSCVGVVVIGAAYLLVTQNDWLIVLGLLVAASGAVMAVSFVPLRAGNLPGAVAWLAAANWSVALGAAAIATFVWPLMVLAALLPAVLAAPYVEVRHLRRYAVVSLVVALGVTGLGVLQDFSGFTDDTPTWLAKGLMVLFVPFLAGMLLMTALQHHSRLQTALAETRRANAELAASRARVVAATDRARRRIEQDLHDGAQQRLVAVGLHLRMAEDLCRAAAHQPDEGHEAHEAHEPHETHETHVANEANLANEAPRTDVAEGGAAVTGEGALVGRAVALVATARAEVHEAHQELRELAHGVYPSVLAQRGLAEALFAAADRCALPVRMEVDVDPRSDAGGRGGMGTPVRDRSVETAVYFCCAEALQNASNHAGPDAVVTVRVTQYPGRLDFVVADDGVGFDAGSAFGARPNDDGPAEPVSVGAEEWGGLANLVDRVGAAGGVLRITSRPGAGTTVAGSIPQHPSP